MFPGNLSPFLIGTFLHFRYSWVCILQPSSNHTRDSVWGSCQATLMASLESSRTSSETKPWWTSLYALDHCSYGSTNDKRASTYSQTPWYFLLRLRYTWLNLPCALQVSSAGGSKAEQHRATATLHCSVLSVYASFFVVQIWCWAIGPKSCNFILITPQNRIHKHLWLMHMILSILVLIFLVLMDQQWFKSWTPNSKMKPELSLDASFFAFTQGFLTIRLLRNLMAGILCSSWRKPDANNETLD